MSSTVFQGKRLAIMQPYFFPYLGYFRLFANVDEFVLYDCVQMPRRGRVHRTEVQRNGTPADWLTLPLARQSREVRICELAFAPSARIEFDRRLAALPWIASSSGPGAGAVREYLHGPLDSVVDYLESGLRLALGLLGLDTPIVRSSSLAIDPTLRSQERILAIANSRGARRYLNSPGGHALYDAGHFADAGISLEFLAPYAGRFLHLLPALMQRNPADIRADLLSQGSLAQ